MYRNFLLANEYQSSKLCEARFSECEDKMDHLQVLKLPSMAKFNAGFFHCNRSFVRECVGPAKESYERRMSKVYNMFPLLQSQDSLHDIYGITQGWNVKFHLHPVLFHLLSNWGRSSFHLFIETYNFFTNSTHFTIFAYSYSWRSTNLSHIALWKILQHSALVPFSDLSIDKRIM